MKNILSEDPSKTKQKMNNRHAFFNEKCDFKMAILGLIDAKCDPKMVMLGLIDEKLKMQGS